MLLFVNLLIDQRLIFFINQRLYSLVVRKRTKKTGGGEKPELNECESLLFNTEENTVKVKGIPGLLESGG